MCGKVVDIFLKHFECNLCVCMFSVYYMDSLLVDPHSGEWMKILPPSSGY